MKTINCDVHFHVVVLIILVTMLYKVVLSYKSVDETPVCDHSNESYCTVHLCSTVYYAVRSGSNIY